MDYRFTAILIILLCLMAFFATPAYPTTTQNNTSGSNTNISGGYTSSATNTYQSGSSSNTTTTNTSTSNIKSAPPTASAPSVTNADVCLAGASAGVQTFGVGISGGKSFRDKNCERIKLSRELNSLGMKVAAVAILCQDERVFEAMEQAGTPCPFEGKIGQQAKAAWQKYNKLRPDHNTYIQNLKIKEEADVEEQNEITKDMQEVDKPKTNWKEPK
jgi:hypothetical protein